jgi:hypothetical protein
VLEAQQRNITTANTPGFLSDRFAGAILMELFRGSHFAGRVRAESLRLPTGLE